MSFQNYDLKSQQKQWSRNALEEKKLIKFANILCCKGTEKKIQNQKSIFLVSSHVKCFNNQENTIFRI